MSRFVTGLIIGAIGVAAIYTMNLNGYTLAAPLVGLAGGLLIGILVGWRNPRPGRALGVGLGTGLLAGLLMLGGQVAGVPRALTGPRASAWMRAITPGSDLFWWLAGGTGALCLILAAGVAGFLAGVLSAWTGVGVRARPPAATRSAEAASLLPGPFE